MSTDYSAQDVISAAIEMEQEGNAFYRTLEANTKDAGARRFFAEFAQEEARHLICFREMRNKLAGETPTEKRADRLAEIAKNLIKPDRERAQKVGQGGDLKAAQELAIGMEEAAILFYRQLREVYPQHEAILSAIIEDEVGHLAALRCLPY